MNPKNNPMKKQSLNNLYRYVIMFMLACTVSACAASNEKKTGKLGVSIHALNYSAREVAYIGVEEPGNPNKGGGGDALNPYSGGGTICCFSIPETWHPDLKVIVNYNLYPDKEYLRKLVSVPPYAGGKAGSIWLIVLPDETVEAVVSHFGPTLPEWPGKIKGYPVATREYRLKLWEEKIEREKADKTAFEKGLQKHDITPAQRSSYIEEIEDINKKIRQLEGNRP